jgi:DNA invertase Pin-like site-specific DNA recombinase
MSTSPITAVTYLRVSGTSQVEGDGFPRQRAACEAYARANGIEIVDEFRDEGVSGCTEPAYRPGLQALIGRLMLNGVRTVLVEHPDRIGRDEEVSPAVRLALRKIPGIRLIAVNTGRNMLARDRFTRMANQQEDTYAAWAREDLVQRLADARARRRQAGIRCDGRKPYGWRDGETAGLDRLLTLVRVEGRSFRAAAATLNAEGFPTRSGKPWQAGSVASVAKSTSSAITRK